jgi:hypothetical protein
MVQGAMGETKARFATNGGKTKKK